MHEAPEQLLSRLEEIADVDEVQSIDDIAGVLRPEWMSNVLVPNDEGES